MAQSTNKKQQTSKKAADKKSKSNKDGFLANNIDAIRWVIGGIILLFGLYTLASVFFYYFNWEADCSYLKGIEDINEMTGRQIANPCGKTGAWLGDLFVGRSFGFFGFIIPICLGAMGYVLAFKHKFFSNKHAFIVVLILILGSLTLSSIFKNSWGIFESGLGGAFGMVMYTQLEGVVGGIGVAFILIASWIATGVFINKNFINTVNHFGGVAINNGGKIMHVIHDKVTETCNKHKNGKKNTITDDDIQEEEDDEYLDEEDEIEEEYTDENEIEEDIIEEGVGQQIQDSISKVESDYLEEDVVPQNLTQPEPENTTVGDVQPIVSPEPEPAPVPAPVESHVEPPVDFEITVPEDDIADNLDINSGTTFADVSIPKQPAHAANEDSGIVVLVGANSATVVDEEDIESALYDPLRDLRNYETPPVNLLIDYQAGSEVDDAEIFENKANIEAKLKHFGIPIQKIKATVGPTITLYEIVQSPEVKISKIQGLENDIAQSLEALAIRIIAPIPGKGTIGIEVPNRHKQIVSMYSAVRSTKFQELKAELPIVIGRNIQNENFVFDLAKMPHLLVAGATGEGKSVGLNAIITSLLYRKHPAQLKFVMIDPKMVEFSPYRRLENHFMAKMESEEDVIITDPKKAVYTLNSICEEMEKRLKLLSKAGVRNVVEYNDKFVSRRLNPEKGHFYMPYIVVVIDEFADLIMIAKEVEMPVMRIAQKARAVGIHMIIATQRPDVKVITGGIKANFPARIAFRVTQMIDSRTIIDQAGANLLIGRGDMLFSKSGDLTRIQCALVETNEVERIVDHISAQPGYSEPYRLPDYSPDAGSDGEIGSESSAPVKYDALFTEVARYAVTNGGISTSAIQRNYEVGFNRAGRIMMQLERSGIVGKQEGAKPRDILFYDIHSLEQRFQELGVF